MANNFNIVIFYDRNVINAGDRFKLTDLAYQINTEIHNVILTDESSWLGKDHIVLCDWLVEHMLILYLMNPM